MKGFGEHQKSKKKSNEITKSSKKQIINQAFKFHSQGKISEAAKYYQYFINQGFKDYRVFSNYGVILKSLGNFQKAELYTRKAIKVNPNFAEAHYNLGILLKNLGNLQEAEFSYRKAIELNPDFAKAYYFLSRILSKSKKYKEALSTITKCLIHEPNNHLYQGEKQRIEFILSI